MVLGLGVCCSQPKIGEQNIHAGIGHQNVLWLEIPMVDSQTVAVLHGIQDLEKGPPNKSIITHVCTSLGNIGEEVSLRTIFEDDKRAFQVIHNLEHRNYVRMDRGCVMKLDLSGLKIPLSLVQRLSIWIVFIQGLHRIPGQSVVVEGRVDDAVRTSPQDGLQLQRFAKEQTYPGFWRRRDSEASIRVSRTRSSPRWRLWRCRRRLKVWSRYWSLEMGSSGRSWRRWRWCQQSMVHGKNRKRNSKDQGPFRWNETFKNLAQRNENGLGLLWTAQPGRYTVV